jgi:hypothetical protein
MPGQDAALLGRSEVGFLKGLFVEADSVVDVNGKALIVFPWPFRQLSEALKHAVDALGVVVICHDR